LNYNLTKRQQQILDYIISHFNQNGYPPTVREICNAVNLSSTSTVHAHLNNLVKKGYLRRDPTKPRCIEVVEDRIDTSTSNLCPQKDTVEIPIVRTLAAGQSLLAAGNIEDNFTVPESFIDSSRIYFMLSIKDSNMIKAGIIDGDYVLVKQQNTASDNDIVVALVDNKPTVTRFFEEDNCIRLQPENSTMEPILISDISSVLILGVVQGVFRRL
jgi:repressor LexA